MNRTHDDGEWVRSDQKSQWVGIAEYDPYLVKGEDREFDRIRPVLEQRLAPELRDLD